ncbi:HET-domain-containing protein [Byssothecium circinans]|uniref:HET-domain-containing protein n=1 Tax=Byssothecium circinans TaxID=147558 RepID=A0A6A5TVF5_9PLEO|nr:HET-domain-containing protein [Byssothecium circinans]
MLCTTCTIIFINPRLTIRQNHQPTLQTLRKAASKFCAICTVLWNMLCRHKWPPMPSPTVASLSLQPVSTYSARRQLGSERSFNLDFIVNANGVGTPGVQGELGIGAQFLLIRERDAEPLLAYTPPETLDAVNFRPLTHHWLSSCLSTHSTCRPLKPTRSQFFTPTRLVRIGTPTHDYIQVVTYPHSESTPASTPYVTLSHCWGSIPTFTLTSTSYPDLKSGIRISLLSKTFQDAIAVTRALGYAFIWIDSLCIIQDSKDDWNHEAPQMQSVYRGAVLNIAATASANGDGGLFRSRQVPSIERTLVRSTWEDGSSQVYRIYHVDFWRHAFEGQPLMNRGWVVQELFLAPRVLHFNEHQMFWECYGAAACEAYPERIPGEVPAGSISRNDTLDILALAHGDSSSGTKELALRLWSQVVKQYTTCQLSHPRDRLVAVAGIARAIQEAIRDEYCAGLWVQSFPTQLLWLSASDELQPQPYRAPSWSWASVDTGVTSGDYETTPSEEIKILAKIISHEVVTATHDPFSEVTSGIIRLSGYLFTVVLRPSQKSRWSVVINEKEYDRQNAQILLDYRPPSLQLHCLPILADLHQYPESWSISCLLLVPTRATRGQFMRCGTLFAFKSAFGISDWTGYQSVKSHKWLEYEAVQSPGVYKISIV